jgi:hypothetical protein
MIDNLERTMVKWAVDYANLGTGKVFFNSENVVLPSPPYISIDIISGPNELSTGAYIYNEATDKFDYKGDVEFNVQYNVYGDDCLKISDRLIGSLSDPIVRAYFKNNNVFQTNAFNFGIIHDGAIQNVNYLKRSVIEMQFRTNSNYSGISRLVQITIEPEDQLENQMQPIVQNL